MLLQEERQEGRPCQEDEEWATPWRAREHIIFASAGTGSLERRIFAGPSS